MAYVNGQWQDDGVNQDAEKYGPSAAFVQRYRAGLEADLASRQGHGLDAEYDEDQAGFTAAHCWTEWDTGTCPHEEG